MNLYYIFFLLKIEYNIFNLQIINKSNKIKY